MDQLSQPLVGQRRSSDSVGWAACHIAGAVSGRGSRGIIGSGSTIGSLRAADYGKFDVVQEGVCWFAEHGSQTVRYPIVISEPLPDQEPAPVPPIWEMHGLPKEEVVGLVQKARGFVEEIEEYDLDKAYHDVRYYITKSTSLRNFARRWSRLLRQRQQLR
jgi:hypothetical protein